MTNMVRRQQRKIAIALLLLNVTGARAIAVTDACDHSRVYYSATLGFKAITKAVTRQQWKPSAAETSFGEKSTRYSARDLDFNRTGGRVVLVAVTSPVSTALDIKTPRAGPLCGWKLPSDENPVQPPHLLI
jgi:hypothetical protein